MNCRCSEHGNCRNVSCNHHQEHETNSEQSGGTCSKWGHCGWANKRVICIQVKKDQANQAKQK